MHGTNPIRPPEKGDGQRLDIQSIFKTLQGEGPRAGQPAIFIRLGGCNLACDFCDTEFESFKPMALGDILNTVQSSLRGGITDAAIHASTRTHDGLPRYARNDSGYLVVITGGEPLRQNIVPLCEALIAAGFTVQIETNGTLFRPLPEAVEIVCSPKNTGTGYAPIRPDLAARITAYKFIVSASHPLYQSVPSGLNALVYVQPMDEGDDKKNEKNKALAIELAHQHGYRFSLQLHKLLGLE